MGQAKIDLKVVLLGRENGGKSTLVERYLHGRWSDQRKQATVGAAFMSRQMQVGNRKVNLGLWDTAGGEQFQSMTKIYYRGAKAAVVCFDLTDQESFARVRFWVDELLENEEQCAIYLCGTKADLLGDNDEGRATPVSEVTDFASQINAKSFDTSSKTGQNINELFETIAHDFANSNPESEQAPTDAPVTLVSATTPEANSCAC